MSCLFVAGLLMLVGRRVTVVEVGCMLFGALLSVVCYSVCAV